MDAKSGSKGLLDEIMSDANKEERNTSINLERNNSSNEDLNISRKEEKIKSGYRLKRSTLEKLNEMKVFIYPPRTSFEDIVDEAICKLYEMKKQEK
jgi:hypothetical protein